MKKRSTPLNANHLIIFMYFIEITIFFVFLINGSVFLINIELPTTNLGGADQSGLLTVPASGWFGHFIQCLSVCCQNAQLSKGVSAVGFPC